MKTVPLVCDFDRRRLFYPVVTLAGRQRIGDGPPRKMLLVASDPRTAARARAAIKKSELAFENIMERAHLGRGRFRIVAKNWCRPLQ